MPEVEDDEVAAAADGQRLPPSSGGIVAAGEPPRRRLEAALVVVKTTVPTLLGRRSMLSLDRTRIGRAAENEIVVPSDDVAPLHAIVEPTGRAWLLHDAGSGAATYLNGARVVAPVPLRADDQIALGFTELVMLAGPEMESRYHELIYRMTISAGS